MINEPVISIRNISGAASGAGLVNGPRGYRRRKESINFQLIYISEGTAMSMNSAVGQNIIASAPVLLIGRQYIDQEWLLSPESRGLVLGIARDFIDQVGDKELQELTELISGYRNLTLTEESNLGPLLEALMVEQGGQSPNTRVTVWILKAFLARCLESVRDGNREQSGQNDLYIQFVSLLRSQTTRKRQVQYYADILLTSSQNLNNACRKIVGRSAGEVLGDYLIEEAKVYLLRTERKVAEISALLEFKDPSHFVKFFKRVTGQTPQGFRERERENAEA